MSKGAVNGWGTGLGPDPATWPPTLTRVYRGRPAAAAALAAEDAAILSTKGYVAVHQAYVEGQWSTSDFAVGCLFILLIGLGLLILAYMLIVKPAGALTVWYARQASPAQPQSPAYQSFPVTGDATKPPPG